MFCANCGSQLSENAAKCSGCGFGVHDTFGISSSGAVQGFLVLLSSFFTMPIRTFRLTIWELREIGNKGSLSINNTQVPHLTWLIAASHLIVSILILMIVLGGFAKGLISLDEIRYSPQDALVQFLSYSIGALLTATAADLVFMLIFEMLGLMVTIANGINKIADREP